MIITTIIITIIVVIITIVVIKIRRGRMMIIRTRRVLIITIEMMIIMIIIMISIIIRIITTIITIIYTHTHAQRSCRIPTWRAARPAETFNNPPACPHVRTFRYVCMYPHTASGSVAGGRSQIALACEGRGKFNLPKNRKHHCKSVSAG